MTTLFNFLSVEQWLAVLRIGLGLWWIKSVLHKPYPFFLKGQMADWTIALADNHPLPALAKPIGEMVNKNRVWFPYLIVLGELAVGIGLTFGLLTPISLVVGIVLNLNYLFLAGVRPKDISVNKAYQCEQGQNWNMIVPQFVLLALGSWQVWSLDALLGLF
jgi:thiosulfate dehydrogenase (quinone) large subunit